MFAYKILKKYLKLDEYFFTRISMNKVFTVYKMHDKKKSPTYADFAL